MEETLQMSTKETQIWNRESDLSFRSVDLRIETEDLDFAHGLAELIRAWNPKSQYGNAGVLLEWCITIGLTSLFPQILQMMDDAGEIPEGVYEEISAKWDEADYDDRNTFENWLPK